LIQGDELGTGFLQFVICMIPKATSNLSPRSIRCSAIGT
jgi:hypothetical protein